MNWLKKRWQDYQYKCICDNAIKELYALSDGELCDIGINRGEIRNLVWLEAQKRKEKEKYV
jgi:hypothetical protein